MRDLLYSDHQPAEPDPVRRAQNAMARHHLPKRFYTEVTLAEAEAGIAISYPQRDLHLDTARPLQIEVVSGPVPSAAQPPAPAAPPAASA
jgi:chaperone required for assembly of F1-ATPase